MSEPEISASGELLYQRVLPLMQKDEEHGWFGRYLCGAIMDGMLQGFDQVVLGSEIDDVLYGPWCIVADPAVCPVPWLPWESALYGVTLPPEANSEVQRRTIEELPPQKRGGIEAMIAAAKPTLTGAKEVYVQERAEGHAYRLIVKTVTSQTPNEQATLNALLSQKPAGLKLVYIVSSGPLIDEGTLEIKEAGGVIATATLANIT